MITKNYLVQNPHDIPVSKQVEIEGQMVSASVAGFEVTLLAQDGMSGSITQRFFGAEVEAAKALFVVDTIVPVAFGS